MACLDGPAPEPERVVRQAFFSKDTPVLPSRWSWARFLFHVLRAKATGHGDDISGDIINQCPHRARKNREAARRHTAPMA